ncbi:hypothetical protein HJC23_011479 [Cyclotella cryptica]|uniref:Uncharacterized protein n=1 Tax=Cyclotella cryptica TaxID=29204 RepID=A0ABD3NXV6_9STRA
MATICMLMNLIRSMATHTAIFLGVISSTIAILAVFPCSLSIFIGLGAIGVGVGTTLIALPLTFFGSLGLRQ